MKFDIWTFLFQVINFVILVYILKRILYRPIRNIIEKRRELVKKTVDDAERIKREAEELKKRYAGELDMLNVQKIQIIEAAQKEAEVEREAILNNARKEAEKIQERERSLFDAEKSRVEAELKHKAAEVVSLFAMRLFSDISDMEMHRGILRKFLDKLEQIATEINVNKTDSTLSIEIGTAYPLSEEETGRIKQTMKTFISRDISVNTVLDTSLIAGLKIKASGKVFDFSLSGQIDSLKLKLKDFI